MALDEISELASKLVGSAYIRQADEQLRARENALKVLLQHRKLPLEGWDEAAVEWLVRRLADMDSNNFSAGVGVGEREGRVLSGLVARRHFRLSHGIGRSGDVTAVQPKAAGSSLVNALANALTLDAIRIAGVRSCAACFVVPVATGMALTLTFLHLKRQRPNAKFAIWSRIDQKSCFKSMLTAGLCPLIVEPQLQGEALSTDLDEIRRLLTLHKDEVLCVFTTTSCFAPRNPDSLIEVAKLCSEYQVAHVVNNAYGLQSSKCCHLIEQAHKVGRVDAFVQSTDKNFLVPVGGAIVGGFDADAVAAIGRAYPGRASVTPSLDVLITLLTVGASGWRHLLHRRKDVFVEFHAKLTEAATALGERLIPTPLNQISMAVTTRCCPADNETLLGSMLFTRCCSGARVVPHANVKTIEGFEFKGWGAHSSNYPCSYLNVAAAIGMATADVDKFLQRWSRVVNDLNAKKAKGENTDLITAIEP